MKSFILKTSALTCLSLAALPSAFSAILIEDTFTRTEGGTQNLNGDLPTTDNIGSLAWVGRNAGSYAKTSDTSGVLTMVTGYNYAAYFGLGSTYFDDNPDVYSLSMDVGFESGSSIASFGLGFTVTPNVNQGMMAPYAQGGQPWIRLEQDGGLDVFMGPGTTNPVYSGSGYTSGTTYNLELVLDTTQTNWTVAAFVDGVQLDLDSGSASLLATFATNPSGLSAPTIATFGDSGNAVATIIGDNFNFSTIPEPTTCALFLGAVALMGVHLRRRRA